MSTGRTSGGLGSVSASVRRRLHGRIAEVSKASRFIPSSSNPHSGALRPIVVVVVLVVDLLVGSGGAGSCWCCHANLIRSTLPPVPRLRWVVVSGHRKSPNRPNLPIHPYLETQAFGEDRRAFLIPRRKFLRLPTALEAFLQSGGLSERLADRLCVKSLLDVVRSQTRFLLPLRESAQRSLCARRSWTGCPCGIGEERLWRKNR
jgi:hypothetical protein